MKIRCTVCKKEIDKKRMLWLVEGGGDICTRCFDSQLKKGITYLVMPHTGAFKGGLDG